MNIKAWIEAMRLRTLPVSLAGVVTGLAIALAAGPVKWIPALLCLAFALLAQIASNFANEYFDFKGGLDRPGREGPRRGVTEGDISPRAMLRAVGVTLALAAAAGCGMIPYGGWWLVPVGIAIGLGALAYSAGPYPLSHHGLGEVAVFFFFGVIPVNLTFYLQTGGFSVDAALASASIGLMGSNVLVINNYRDMPDDEAVGKLTLAVRWGRNAMSAMYLLSGVLAVALMAPFWLIRGWAAVVPAAYLAFHAGLWLKMRSRSGRSLNPLLGLTACLMALYSLGILWAAA